MTCKSIAFKDKKGWQEGRAMCVNRRRNENSQVNQRSDKLMKKSIAIILVILVAVAFISGCAQSGPTPRYEFQNRRFCIINTRTNELMFELVGTFTLSNSSYANWLLLAESPPMSTNSFLFPVIQRQYTLLRI